MRFPDSRPVVVASILVILCSAPGATAREIPLATTVAAELIDIDGVPLAALEDGLTAAVFVVGESDGRLKMQWLDAAGRPLFAADGLEIAGDDGDITGASVIARPGGGAFVAYARVAGSGDPRLFAQAFDRSGAPLWPGSGVRVSTLPGPQREVALVPDFVGGVYACFARPDQRAAACQHLDRDGDRLWTEAGHDVGGGPGLKIRPQVAYDGAEGLLVFWRNQGDLTDERPDFATVEGQHFNSPGVALWGDGIEVRSTYLPESADSPAGVLAALGDGNGGAYVIYSARLSVNSPNLDVVMQRVSGGDNLLWEDFRPVIADPGATELAAVVPAPDGGFVVITQEPADVAGSHLRLFRIDPQGFQLWGASGLALSDPTSTTLDMLPHADFHGGVLRVAWTRQVAESSPEMDIDLARFNLDGSRLGRVDSVVTAAPNSQLCRGLVFHSSPPRTVVLWEDLRKGSPADVDIYAGLFRASALFGDGFELGDTSAWTTVTP
ncbi:MAG: hypothetical protein AAGF23_15795 [Acidobacteriota bacterium]